MMRVLLATFVGALLLAMGSAWLAPAAAPLAAGGASRAAAEPPGPPVEAACPAVMATTDLARCPRCALVKSILGAVRAGRLSVEAYALDHGMLLQMDGHGEEAVRWIHATIQRMDELPDRLAAGERLELCRVCSRHVQDLSRAMEDVVLTDSGALLVAISSDPGLAGKLQEDARMQQRWIVAATSR